MSDSNKQDFIIKEYLMFTLLYLELKGWAQSKTTKIHKSKI